MGKRYRLAGLCASILLALVAWEMPVAAQNVVEGASASPLSDAPKIAEELAQTIGRLQSNPAALASLRDLVAKRMADAHKPAPGAEGAISFNRQIRPIFLAKCYSCHGPDENQRKGGFRLDDATIAFDALKSGHIPLVPHDRAKSELIRRITTSDPSDRMPPVSSGKTLSSEEIELLGRWVDQGAKWEKHWAFVKPERPAVPETKSKAWVKNPIDAFILARLEKEGLESSPETDRRTLIRRVTLDLTGLPPTTKEVEDFVADAGANPYEKVVDRLLASTRYGEHMARYWLDAARYADTNGYHIDNERFMWRWRDWVIDSFNRNEHFDQFTLEQLAGDLLPNATLDQRMASGFNRNHMINFEGGAIPDEYRTNYVIDRVNTTSTVWLGLTVNCAQCHNHKFDPISRKEFYQLFAFFNQVPEEGLDGREGNSVPRIQAPLPDQAVKLAAFEEKMKPLRERMNRPMPLLDPLQDAWERKKGEELRTKWTTLDPAEFKSAGGAALKKLDDKSILAGGTNPDQETYELAAQIKAEGITAIRLEVMPDESLPKKSVGRADNGNFVLGEFEAEIAPPFDPGATEKIPFALANADYSQKDFEIAKAVDGKPETGWAVDGKAENRTAVFLPERPFGYKGGSLLRVRFKTGTSHAHHHIGRFRLSVTSDASYGVSELGPWYLNGPFPAKDGNTAYQTAYEPEKKIDLNATYEDGKAKWVQRQDLKDMKANNLLGDVCATYLYRVVKSPGDHKMTLSLGSNDAIKVWVNGAVVHDKNVQRLLRPNEDQVTVDLRKGDNAILMKVVNYGASYAFYFRKADEQVGEFPFGVEQILLSDRKSQTPAQRGQVRDYFRRGHSPEWGKLEAETTAVNNEKIEFDKQIPTTMVMQEIEKPRETYMLERGQYDQTGEKVQAGTPAALPPLPSGQPVNRLALARWMIDPANPLTARVTVNRFWQQCFGTGIVKTVEDFGVQGEWPSHPELLDWLATDFVQSGWDVKRLMRLMVTSAAYRQSSRVKPELLQKDPENRLLARGPRFRMDAEMVRDGALAVSGLLVEKVGGPSVKPYQPQGIWEEVAYGAEFSAQRYAQDHGDALYRRSMYTFWKRQAPPPTMLIFDAPNREICTVRRSRTNTPLQALALLNSPQFVEAARGLAQRMMKEGGVEPAARIAFAFELATARKPTQQESAILLKAFTAQLEECRKNAESASRILEVGESKRDDKLDASELAAWTTVAGMILNLDETVTKG